MFFSHSTSSDLPERSKRIHNLAPPVFFFGLRTNGFSDGEPVISSVDGGGCGGGSFLERRRKEKKLLLFLPIDHCSVSSLASALV